jgi:arylsulfatase A
MNTMHSLMLAAMACFATLAAAAEKPNILLIFADDIGYEALNSYGGLDFETPNLNRMAEQGIRFSRAHTSPVCTPSRVSLHTGLYVTRHGHDTVLPVHNGTEKMTDARNLPTEKPADFSDPETAAAKSKLEAVFQKIQRNGPRPPEPFVK